MKHRRVDFIVIPKGHTACEIRTVDAVMHEDGTVQWAPLGETVLAVGMVVWDGHRLEDSCLFSKDNVDVREVPKFGVE